MKKLLLTLAVLMSALYSSAENYILYTSTNGKVVKPKEKDGNGNLLFGANIVSNTYEDGQGKIIFDGEVTKIGYKAFYIPRTKLSSIEIPNSVTEIGEEAFSKCGYLSSVTIGNSVKKISYGAFDECDELKAINIVDLAAWCKIDFDYSNPLSRARYLYLNGELVTNLVIPNSVTSIANQAFSDCLSLTSAVIPNSVTEIGEDAFSFCKNLESVVIPNSVITIGDAAFQCTGLASVELPNSVVSIGSCAFANCNHLTSFSLPESIEEIGKCIVSGEKLDAVYGKFASEDNHCIICDNQLIAFAGASLESYDVPNKITTIGSFAMSSTKLKSIKLPASLVSIESGALRYDYYLSEIISLNANPPSLGYESIVGINTEICVVKVPAAAVEAYKAAGKWKEFQNIVALSDEEYEAVGIYDVILDGNMGAVGQTINLLGQPVSKDFKGIVIEDGKKVMKK